MVKAFLTIISMSLLLSCLVLSGCGKKKHHHLEKYIETVKARKAQPIEDMPELKDYATHEYREEQGRDPFRQVQHKVAVVGQRPDDSRDKEILEAFPLDALRLVGLLQHGDRVWALVKDPQDAVHRISLGSYIGRNYGKVVSISSKAVKLIEKVQIGNRWEERAVELSMKQSERATNLPKGA